jgi:hypothetical protein
MQTFLPYPNFAASAYVLDDRRLGKQRVEAFQILRALVFPNYAWKQHPAVRMWRGFVPALVTYGVACSDEWTDRGFSDRVRESLLTFTGGRLPDEMHLRAEGQMPPWLGLAALHESHQSALVRKDPEYYRTYFPFVADDLPYLWPSDSFPHWPLRHPGDAPLSPEAAVWACGFDNPRAGQREAAQAVQAGRDVLLCFPSGWGATTTGLIASMTRPGPTLWITPHAGPVAPVPLPSAGPPLRTPVPVSRTGSEPPPLTARPPRPEDLLALSAEVTAVPEHMFHRPADLDDPALRSRLADDGVGLVVIDKTDKLQPTELRSVAKLHALLPGVPLLALSEPAGPRHRTRLITGAGLVDPVLAGGGINPHIVLTANVVASEQARRDVIAAEIGFRRTLTLVVVNDSRRVPAVAAGLQRRGVSAGGYLSGRRNRRQDEALAAWRTGRLGALVVDRAAKPDPGRRAVGLLVHYGPPPGLNAFREDLHRLRSDRPSTALMVATDAERRTLLETADDEAMSEHGLAALGRYLSATPKRRMCVYRDAWGIPCDAGDDKTADVCTKNR